MNYISRSINELIRTDISWDEAWQGEDIGLIKCWEVGRGKRTMEAESAVKAENNEFPVLGWKGGVSKTLQVKEKYGSLNYLAQWQGLRGEDLNIDMTTETTLICSKTGMKIIFTPDRNKYSNS